MDEEKSFQEQEDEEFEKWFWDKYKHQPESIEQWCDYWEHE